MPPPNNGAKAIIHQKRLKQYRPEITYVQVADSAASLGKMGQVDDPVVVAAVDRVIEASKRAGLGLGWFALDADSLKRYRDRGCNLLAGSVDSLFLGQAAREFLDSLR